MEALLCIEKTFCIIEALLESDALLGIGRAPSMKKRPCLAKMETFFSKDESLPQTKKTLFCIEKALSDKKISFSTSRSRRAARKKIEWGRPVVWRHVRPMGAPTVWGGN